ncbi:MAG: sulfate adenylyltransferase [Candidatus Omnitrophica bacterium]|nr:sulfate adenylyltransferase [Candidatus Omnitrophota bacterium]
MIKPHGGRLINRYVKTGSVAPLRGLPRVRLSEVALSDLYNIADGTFSPLTGFMRGPELGDVINRNKVNGVPWTIPVVLDADKAAVNGLKKGKSIALEGDDGKVVARMELEDIYTHKKDEYALKVFGTRDRRHPGVNLAYEMKEYLLGGKVHVFRKQDNVKNYLSPLEVRKIITDKGYKSVAGFQTRNVLHRAHEYLQRCALEHVDGLFLQPIIGWKKKGDFTADAIIKAYREFISDYYPGNRVVFGTLKTAMRYAGPKEAVFHAIIRKNFGCTHFIVGRDHAGVGGYYGKYEAHDIFDKIGDVGINILKFKEPLYCKKCDLVVTEKTCGHGPEYHQEISGTLVRKIIKNGHQPKHKIFRPEVYKILLKEFKRKHLFY